MQKIFDPHLHFFDLTKGKYAWLKPQNPPSWPDKPLISKNVMPNQLTLNNHFTLVGGVHIEAGFDNDLPHCELQWLEQDVYPITPKFGFKSIAYADLKIPNSDFMKQLELLATFETFVGIRYIIDEIELFMAEVKNISENLKFLENACIVLEIQLLISDDLQTSSLLSVLSGAPELTIVINHAGLPPIPTTSSLHTKQINKNCDENEMQRWKNNLGRFAQIRNCFVKCSGFEMQSRTYTSKDVFDVISFVHILFGNERIMFASNFPLTLFSTSYAAYWQLLYDCAKEANIDCERVMHENAKNLYVLNNKRLR